MVDTLETGVTSAFELLMFAVLFWMGTVVVQVFVLLWARGTLKKVGHPSGLATLLFALIGCGLVPLLGGYVGCSFAGQRAIANTIEHAPLNQLTDKIVDEGVKELRDLRREMGMPADDQSLVDIEALRGGIAKKLDESGSGIDGFAERVWWRAVGFALEKVAQRITWGALIQKLEVEVRAKIKEEIGAQTDSLRASARKTVWFYLAFLALANGIALILVRRAAAKPPRPKLAPAS